MNLDKTLEHVRSVNPAPVDLAAPPVEPLLERLDLSIRALDERVAVPTTRRVRSAAIPRAAAGVAVATGAVLGAIAIVGDPGRGGLNVAAAVNRAITPGPGVLHIVVDTENTVAGHVTNAVHQELWTVQNPRRMRSVSTLKSAGEGTVEAEGALVSTSPPRALSWSPSEPGVIHENNSPVDRTEQSAVDWLRKVYHEGRLKPIGQSEVGGRPVWRLKVLPDASRPAQTLDGQPLPAPTVLVDAHTFVPLENVVYSTARQNGKTVLSTTTVRYASYEELPATPGNERLLNLASHPGAKIVADPKAPGEN